MAARAPSRRRHFAWRLALPPIAHPYPRTLPSTSEAHTPPPDDDSIDDDEFGDASGGDTDAGSDSPASSAGAPPTTPPAAPGLTGAKGDAMARAFAKVMAGDARTGAAAVLASSKSVTKRAAGDAEAAAADAAAKKLRKEMRRRGHAVSLERGRETGWGGIVGF